MHHKNIKLSIRKQLKNQYPHWNRLNRKTKKEIARKVLTEVTNEYDFNGDITASQVEPTYHRTTGSCQRYYKARQDG